MDSVLVDSVLVIPWPFWNPLEFCGMEIIILAGTTAKIPFRRIPKIDRILPDSGRNTWGTVKNSIEVVVEEVPVTKGISKLQMFFAVHLSISPSVMRRLGPVCMLLSVFTSCYWVVQSLCLW